MSIPVHSLNREQRKWYAQTVIGAILADDEISPSEIDFLKQVIAVVDHPEEKKELMQMISSKKRPALTEPPGISNEILSAIFIELSLIMISDLDFADKEKEFLKEVAELFRFENSYFIELMNWAEEGLQWKESQRQLLSDGGGVENTQVPVDKLNGEQKKWYAETLISTILLDRVVDEAETSFLKAAVSFVNDRKQQQKLLGYVRNKMSPPLQKPPAFPQNILVLIFIEIMRIVSADETMSYAEHAHLKQISDLCGFSAALYDKLLAWCNRGISWMQNKNPLIANFKIDQKKVKTSSKSAFQSHPDNNSILNREFQCFVCESSANVKFFQLKPHSHEPKRNIFGITTYEESKKDFDFIDYNLVKVIVCPTCYFASVDKDLFRKNKKESVPDNLKNPKFKNLWMKDAKQRKKKFEDKESEVFSINRSLPTVVKTYQLAIKVAETLGKVNNDDAQKWQAVTLQLILAEIFLNAGKIVKAIEFLFKAKGDADFLFKNATNKEISFKSARLLFFIALYENDIRIASPMVEFLREYKFKKSETLASKELLLLKKIFGETKKALAERAIYKKENLIGFLLND